MVLLIIWQCTWCHSLTLHPQQGILWPKVSTEPSMVEDLWHRWLCHLQIKKFTYSFLIWKLFLSFSCLEHWLEFLVQFWTEVVRPDNFGLLLIIEENIQSFTISYVSNRFFIDCFIMLRKFHFIPSLLKVFLKIRNGYQILSNAFPVSIEIIYLVFFFTQLIV